MEALRSLLNVFACGQVSSPRLYRLTVDHNAYQLKQKLIRLFILIGILKGAKLAEYECKRVLNKERWNCPNLIEQFQNSLAKNSQKPTILSKSKTLY